MSLALPLIQQLQHLNSSVYLLTQEPSSSSVELFSTAQLEQLCSETIDPKKISFINDIKGDFFALESFLKITLSALVSGALFFGDRTHVLLHCYPYQKWLRIDLSNKEFNFTDADSQSFVLPEEAFSSALPSIMGLGLLNLILKHFGGKLEICNFNLQGQTISAYLPYSSKEQLQQQLMSFFEPSPLAIIINDSQYYETVVSLLNNWRIPFSFKLTDTQQLLITDQTEHQHSAKKTLYLPAIKQESLNESKLIQQLLLLTQKQNLNTTPQTLSLLFVDSNTINLKHCQEVLLPFNFHIKAAKNGIQAVEMAQHEQFQLIFMACDLPVMDGFTATQIIRQNSKNQQTPIIALAGNSSEQQQCLLAGMDDFISKPFDQEQLTTIISQWTDGF